MNKVGGGGGWPVGGLGGELLVKQTAVSHGHIVSIAPRLDSSSPSSHLQLPALPTSAGAAESEMNRSELSQLTACDDEEVPW